MKSGKRLTVAVLFGGRSAEHDVSIMSAANVMQAIDQARYEVVPIKIERDGRWILQRFSAEEAMENLASTGIQGALMPGGSGALATVSHAAEVGSTPSIDVLFPVLHGPFGEDGTVQGLAEVTGIPYVGCGVASSALCMDKDFTKRLLVPAGIPMAQSITLQRRDSISFDEVVSQLGAPVFVKPARQGSSFGVGKADTAAGFAEALSTAFQHDNKLLVEEFVEAREIECAVLEKPDGSLIVSDPGEIITASTHAFYTYEAKYFDAGGTVINTPAEISEALKSQCRAYAAKVFQVLECSGMARVDFFLRADGSLVLNEVNTIPGFTNMSMYPQALAANGISYAEAVNTLLETALARHAASIHAE